MKKIIIVIVICCFQLPIIVTGQSTQILKILEQAQSSNALRQKYTIVDASDTNQLCIKYNNQFGICYDDEEVIADLRRAPAKDGEGYMPILTDDTVTFSIAFQITMKDYNPFFLGGESDFYSSAPSDTVYFNNKKYREFRLYDNYYLREDTLAGRLFRYYPQLDTEVLTCDISLLEGDTFYLPHSLDDNFYYVELTQEYWIVDSVTYSNGRKVIWFPYVTASGGSFFAHNWNGYQPYFMEGIGPAYGPFGMLPISAEPYLGFLLCVHHNDSLIYMTDTVLGCEQAVVSVPEYSDVSMKLYPNPTTNTLHVDFESTDDPQGTLTVTDITGVAVLTRECHDAATQIDVSGLFPGLYVISFRNEKGVIVRKFVKM